MSATAWIKHLLDERGADYRELHHRETFTAQETAQAEHLSGRRVAKTVIAIADDRPLILALPATKQVALDRLLGVLGTGCVRLATESEIAEHFPDCELGAVPPLQHWNGAALLMDPSMKVEGNILFQAGTRFDAIRMNFEDWYCIARPRVVQFVDGGLATAQPIGGADGRIDRDPRQSTRLLLDLLHTLQIQAKEIERLRAHVEQQTDRMLEPTQMPAVISELSGLAARLKNERDSRPAVSQDPKANELAGQRVPVLDMDPLC